MKLFSKNDLNHIDFSKFDPEGVCAVIDGFAANCKKAWSNASGFSFPSYYAKSNKFIIIGMGGSGIAGDMVRDLLQEKNIFIQSVHDYHLPGWVDKDTIIIACSHSGNTEEILNAFCEGYNKSAKLLAITQGGKLKSLSEKYGAPCLTYTFEGEPRFAFPYLFISLLSVFQKLGYLDFNEKILSKIFNSLENLNDKVKPSVSTDKNICKALSDKLVGKVPYVLAANHLSSVARRFKTQFSENSKNLAVYDVYPELNHNMIEASHPKNGFHVISLDSNFYKPEIQKRQKITMDVYNKNGIPSEIVSFHCDNIVEEILFFVLFGDYVSYYLGILNKVNISKIKNIKYLKSQL